MKAAQKIETQNQIQKPVAKRTISGVQFKAVQKAVESVIHDVAPESTTRAVVQSAVFGIKIGERSELLLQVEAERIVDARHVELRLIDGANRRYIWLGTTGEAARLRVGQVVLLKASAVGQDNSGMQIKHCRVIEVG